MSTDGQEQDEEDSGPVTQAIYPDRGPNPDKMAGEYLPEGDDWLAKTVLEQNDAAAIAALSQFDRVFPEVQDLQPIIDGFLDQFYRGKTSEFGMSRDEYKAIIMSMYGGQVDDETRGMIQGMLAGDMDDD